MAGDTEKKRARLDASGGVATSVAVVSSDSALLALTPIDQPLVIGQRGLAELLGDLAVATDDLSS